MKRFHDLKYYNTQYNNRPILQTVNRNNCYWKDFKYRFNSTRYIK